MNHEGRTFYRHDRNRDCVLHRRGEVPGRRPKASDLEHESGGCHHRLCAFGCTGLRDGQRKFAYIPFSLGDLKMPIVAILLGIVLIDLGFRGTEHEFAKQLGQDLGNGQFISWLAAISIIGAIGYYSPLKRISDLGVALVIISLVFSKQGVIAQFAKTIEQPAAAAASVPLPSFTSGSSSSSGGGSSTSSLQTYGELAAVAAA